MIKLKAILYAARSDRYGSWKVTFEVSEAQGIEVAKLTALKEQVLDIEIKPEPEEDK